MIEIDGPKMSYFEHNGMRYEYKKLYVEGSNPVEIAWKLDEVLGREMKGKAIVFWRSRPAVRTVDDENGIPLADRFIASARLIAI